MNKCRCDERLQTKTKEFTRLPYTGLVLEPERLFLYMCVHFFFSGVRSPLPKLPEVSLSSARSGIERNESENYLDESQIQGFTSAAKVFAATIAALATIRHLAPLYHTLICFACVWPGL
jgi:hypothetical protein